MWTLNRPLKNLFFKNYSEEDTLCVLLQNMSEQTDIVLEFMVPLIISRSWSSKATPDHHTTTTMLNCWCDVPVMKCCLSFTSAAMSIDHFPPNNQTSCFGPCEMSRRFSWKSPIDAASPSLSYCWITGFDIKGVWLRKLNPALQKWCG